VAGALYLDTSAVLRAALEAGLAPEIDAAIRGAHVLVTSRLSLVESSRALQRVRLAGRLSERALAEAERSVESIWHRTDIWELTASICEAARHVAPGKPLRALDALHLATYVAARRRIEGLELLTADDRLQAAAEIA
jgi:predicted nucleic acid-binding protein